MFLAIVGVIFILAVLSKVGRYVYQHFFVNTDLSVYGAKQGSWAVVTGASEGIGRGFAVALASKGFNVVIIARRPEALQAVRDETAKFGVETKILPVDCNEVGAHTKVVDAVKDLPVSILVNNVGVNTRYPEMLNDTEDADIDRMINVNITFTTKLTKAMLPILAKRRSAIFNLSSFTGRVPIAMMAIYSATKSYVDVFSRALAAELKPTGIDVTSVLPHYVVSIMSGVRKASWAIPEAIPFANSALRQLSCGDYSIAPHWWHDLTTILTQFIPDSVLGQQTFKKMQFVRKRLIARDQKEAAAAKKD